MYKLCSICLVVLVLASCNNSGKPTITDPLPPSPATVSAPPVPALDSNKPNTIMNKPIAPSIKATTNSGAIVARNPAHGQPGHRCDIATGAPLNSPAGITPAPILNNNSAPITPQAPTTPTPVTNKIRLNPAHGAPGHDCTIPVGQPLKN